VAVSHINQLDPVVIPAFKTCLAQVVIMDAQPPNNKPQAPPIQWHTQWRSFHHDDNNYQGDYIDHLLNVKHTTDLFSLVRREIRRVGPVCGELQVIRPILPALPLVVGIKKSF
jgi:hypothetical protein